MQTLWAWFFILIIIFHFIPISIVSHPIEHVWSSAVTIPLTALPYCARLTLLWLAALAITFGSAFGFERLEVHVLDLCSVQGICLVAVHHVPPFSLLLSFLHPGVSDVLTMMLGRAQ